MVPVPFAEEHVGEPAQDPHDAQCDAVDEILRRVMELCAQLFQLAGRHRRRLPVILVAEQ